MSILAINAAPFDENEYNRDERRPRNRNRTLRRNQPTNRIQSIMDRLNSSEPTDDKMGDFTPPSYPVSIGASKKESNDNNIQLNDSSDDLPVQNEMYRSLGDETSEFIIKPQMLPDTMSDNLVATKLDKMLFILEEQRDFKTSSVTEDVILYSFLGIFVIVIVDSFTKVGQYTR